MPLVTYDVVPLVGVGPLRFGMPAGEVRMAMPGPRLTFRKGLTSGVEVDAFHDNGFQVFYGGDPPIVEYIELSSNSGIRALCRGLDVFGLPAEQIVSRITEDFAFDPKVRELGYSYIFPDLDLSLWRPVLPKSNDDPEGRVFRAIGIGFKGYYGERA